MKSSHDDLLNEVLIKIGINIVIFQKIEKGLKLLLPFLYIPNSPEQDIDVFRKNRKQVKSQTLGGLVNKFLESSDYDVEYFAEHLKKIVCERNKLVHDFAGLKTLNTEEGCRACIDDLETQRREAYDFYKTIQLFVFSVLVFLRDNYGESHPKIDSLYKNLKSILFIEGKYEYVDLSNPSETIWEKTKIVKLLRKAELNTYKVDGMTSLARAGEFIKKEDPECTPKKYGIKTLKGILKVSGVFEVSQHIQPNSTNILYRSKLGHSEKSGS